MLQKIRDYITAYGMIENNDSIILGVSGGADSVALLYALHELSEQIKFALSVVHVNHGIRDEAKEDANYVKFVCDQLGIGCKVYEADIPFMAKQEKKTEEEMGRDYRYRCFFETAKELGATKIAVAHHKNDQAETVLFHLIRGTDMKGMTGIKPVFVKDGFTLIRPLLCVEREEIEAWLRGRGIIWKEDCTNKDVTYARNRLRVNVMPELAKINARTITHIAELAGTMAEYEAYFDGQVETYIRENVSMKEEISLNRKMLLDEAPILGKRVLYELLGMLMESKKDICREHINAMYELMGNQTGKYIELPGGIRVETVYENLVIRKCLKGECETDKQDFSTFFSMEYIDWEALSVEEREVLMREIINSKNNYTKYFDCDTIRDKLCVRTPETDDYLIISKDGQQKKLSRYFIDTKVPAGMRKQQLLLAAGHEVLWVLGGRRGEGYKVTPETKCVVKVTFKGEKDESD